MAGIKLDSRVPSKIPADMYICFGCTNIQCMRIDTPFSRNIFRYCPNAYRAIRRRMETKGCEMGKAIVSRDRIYRERKDLRQRFFDVYVAYIPVRADSLQYDARRSHIIKAIHSAEKAVIDRGAHVRVAVLNDIQQFISDTDAFELDLQVEKMYRKLGEKVRMILSYGDYTKWDRYMRDEYGFIARI